MNELNKKNLDELLSIGGQDLVIELIHLFFDESIHVIQKLNQVVGKDQQEVIGQIAHKLKSSSGSLGLSEMSELCFKIDTKHRNSDQITSLDVEQLILAIQLGRELLLNYKKTII